MRPEELIALIRMQPFCPLRIYLTDGHTYDVKHPDQIIVSRGRVDIGVEPDVSTGVVDRIDHCSLLHVVRVEELQSAQRGDGNGRGH
jgi:hypothetical protein